MYKLQNIDFCGGDANESFANLQLGVHKLLLHFILFLWDRLSYLFVMFVGTVLRIPITHILWMRYSRVDHQLSKDQLSKTLVNQKGYEWQK
jgi:hypothetical protein